LDPALIGADVGLTLDPWQASLLRDMPRRALLLCSRQSGKTTVCQLMAIHVALYEPGSLVIVASPSQRQSAEFLRGVVRYHAKMVGVPALNAESTLRAELANGSRILALPGSERTIRGYAAPSLVILDEAARIDDELISAVRPMMATNQGRLICLTTPAGKRGFFFDAWHGDGDWTRVRVAASDCPRITEEFLQEELKELGMSKFSEEYNLTFVDADEAVFPTEIIARAFTTEVTPLWR
jgi:hypothetical protein